MALPSFSSISFYYNTCKQLNILPLIFRFRLKDLTFFHSIFYKKSVVELPSYLSHFQGSRLRNCHLDSLCVSSSVQPNTPQILESLSTSTGITKLFFTEIIQSGTVYLQNLEKQNQKHCLKKNLKIIFGMKFYHWLTFLLSYLMNQKLRTVMCQGKM